MPVTVLSLDRFRGGRLTPCVALGFFDGVHRGHQQVIRRGYTESRRRGVPLAVFTFKTHPQAVLHPAHPPRLLTTFEERVAALAELGVEYLVWTEFTKEFARHTPEAFIRDILVGRLGASAVYAGYNYHFGWRAAGTVALLAKEGPRYGFEVRIHRPVQVQGMTVSSTLIRDVVGKGEMARARLLLGRPYALQGRVTKGHGRGRGLGSATANMLLPEEKVAPAEGVYAVAARWGEDLWRPAVANVGAPPTFGDRDARLEVHVLDGSPSLEGRVLSVAFLERLREQRRFSGPVELAAQIARDIQRARAVAAREARLSQGLFHVAAHQ